MLHNLNRIATVDYFKVVPLTIIACKMPKGSETLQKYEVIQRLATVIMLLQISIITVLLRARTTPQSLRLRSNCFDRLSGTCTVSAIFFHKYKASLCQHLNFHNIIIMYSHAKANFTKVFPVCF